MEEASIIVNERSKEVTESKGGEKTEKESEGRAGKLDIGWLNSRSGKVGRDYEAELWEKARGFLEGAKSNLYGDNGDAIMEG